MRVQPLSRRWNSAMLAGPSYRGQMKVFFGAALGLCWGWISLAQGPASTPASVPSSQPAQEAANALTPESQPVSAPASAPSTQVVFLPPESIPPLTQRVPWRSSPSTATSLALVPGLGHIYLGKYGQAAGY